MTLSKTRSWRQQFTWYINLSAYLHYYLFALNFPPFWSLQKFNILKKWKMKATPLMVCFIKFNTLWWPHRFIGVLSYRTMLVNLEFFLNRHFCLLISLLEYVVCVYWKPIVQQSWQPQGLKEYKVFALYLQVFLNCLWRRRCGVSFFFERISYYCSWLIVLNCFKQVQLNLTVMSLLYNTTSAYYNCAVAQGACSLKMFFPNGNSAVLTSPGPEQVGL